MSMALTAAELDMAEDLLRALNNAPARLAQTGAIPFVLNTGVWVYVEYSDEQHQHVVVGNPE